MKGKLSIEDDINCVKIWILLLMYIKVQTYIWVIQLILWLHIDVEHTQLDVVDSVDVYTTIGKTLTTTYGDEPKLILFLAKCRKYTIR